MSQHHISGESSIGQFVVHLINPLFNSSASIERKQHLLIGPEGSICVCADRDISLHTTTESLMGL